MNSLFAPERAAACAAVALLVLPAALAQSDLRSRLQPVTGPVRNAGVYHLATGTWTRGAGLAGVGGQGVIYDNTCFTGYMSTMRQNEKWQHRSSIPSPTHPSVPTIVPGQSGYDDAPGCSTSYLVSGFQIAYCSSATTDVDWLLEFADLYEFCGGSDMVPTHAFSVTGMPGGTSSSAANCWTVDIDLSVGGLSFVAQADGDGGFTNPGSLNTFGWSWSPTNAVTGTFTGPLIAGNYDWLGGPAHPGLTPCKGTGGTLWDSPIDLSAEGTGMNSQDFFRVTGSNPSVPAGCYFFGGILHADFHLQLFADGGCPTAGSSIAFCVPGQQGWNPCTCGNPSTTAGAGCNNSAGTGGALLATSGSASVSADTLLLSGSGMISTSTCVYVQAEGQTAPGTAAFGDGIRCVSGNILRIGAKANVGGASSYPGFLDPSVSARSAALGFPIPASSTRFYQTYYRDPGAFGCPAFFNITNGRRVLWAP